MVKTSILLLTLLTLSGCASIYIDPNPNDKTGAEIELLLREKSAEKRIKYDGDDIIFLKNGSRYDFWVVARDRQSGIRSGSARYIERNDCDNACARFRTNSRFSLERPLASHIVSAGHIELDNGSSVELLQNVLNGIGRSTEKRFKFVRLSPFQLKVDPLEDYALMGDRIRMEFSDPKAKSVPTAEILDLPPQPSTAEKIVISNKTPALDQDDYDKMSFDLTVNFGDPRLNSFISPTLTESSNARFKTRRASTQPFPVQNFNISNMDATQLGSNILVPGFIPSTQNDDTGRESMSVIKCIRRVFPQNGDLNVEVEGAYKVKFEVEFLRERTVLGVKWTKWKPSVDEITFLGFVYKGEPCGKATMNIDRLPNG